MVDEAQPLSDDDVQPIRDDEVAFHLELTPPELKIAYSALHAFLDNFGHDQPEVHRIVHRLLAKFPPEHSIRAIDIDRGLRDR
jgi:hypothetical protein